MGKNILITESQFNDLLNNGSSNKNNSDELENDLGYLWDNSDMNIPFDADKLKGYQNIEDDPDYETVNYLIDLITVAKSNLDMMLETLQENPSNPQNKSKWMRLKGKASKISELLNEIFEIPWCDE